ncbi:MAG: hypothetical protein HY695_34555 [Deltaproteobacteria bacterium]|nr:hypothetical protein [Deltaproteobacteria bacterium]
MQGNKYPIAGLVLTAIGVIATYDLSLPRGQRIIPASLGVLIFFGPALLISGLVVCGRHFAAESPRSFYRILLALGVLMVVLGAIPWIYTPYLTGDRPGGEAAGMLGTILFITVGLPGLFVTVIAIRGMRREP